MAGDRKLVAHVTANITMKEYEAVLQVAGEKGITASKVAREALRLYLKSCGKRIDEE